MTLIPPYSPYAPYSPYVLYGPLHTSPLRIFNNNPAISRGVVCPQPYRADRDGDLDHAGRGKQRISIDSYRQSRLEMLHINTCVASKIGHQRFNFTAQNRILFLYTHAKKYPRRQKQT